MVFNVSKLKMVSNLGNVHNAGILSSCMRALSEVRNEAIGLLPNCGALSAIILLERRVNES